MFNILKRFMQERRERRIGELNSVLRQISEVLHENNELRNVATRCARDSVSHLDETRASRTNDRSSILRSNCELLAKLGARETRLKQKLGIR